MDMPLQIKESCSRDLTSFSKAGMCQPSVGAAERKQQHISQTWAKKALLLSRDELQGTLQATSGLHRHLHGIYVNCRITLFFSQQHKHLANQIFSGIYSFLQEHFQNKEKRAFAKNMQAVDGFAYFGSV